MHCTNMKVNSVEVNVVVWGSGLRSFVPILTHGFINDA